MIRSPLPNVWMGVSCEDQPRKERIDMLRTVQAAVRFLSLEPLLEDLGTLDLRAIDWVIVGGESGPGARPCNIEWIRSIARQCRAAGVPCFVKQLGANVLVRNDECSELLDECAISLDDVDTSGVVMQGDLVRVRLRDRKGGNINEWPSDLRVREMPT